MKKCTCILLVIALTALLSACKPRVVEMPNGITVAELATLLDGQMVSHDAQAEDEIFLHEPNEDRVVALRQFVRLGPNAAVVLTRAQTAVGTAASFQRGDAHAESALVGLVYLKWADNKWTVNKRLTGEMTLGSHGEFGQVDVLELRPGLKALLIHSGGVWQGSSITRGDVIPLDYSAPHSIASIALESSNEGGCGPETDCWNASSVVTLKPSTKKGAMPEIHVAQTLSRLISPFNEPSFESLDDAAQEALRQKYQGDEVPRREEVSHAQLVYKWTGKKFELKSGKNIVPEI